MDFLIPTHRGVSTKDLVAKFKNYPRARWTDDGKVGNVVEGKDRVRVATVQCDAAVGQKPAGIRRLLSLAIMLLEHEQKMGCVVKAAGVVARGTVVNAEGRTYIPLLTADFGLVVINFIEIADIGDDVDELVEIEKEG